MAELARFFQYLILIIPLMYKRNLYLKPLTIGVALFFLNNSIMSQSKSNLQSLYEQATETSGLVQQYTQDERAVDYFYSPMGTGFRWGSPAVNSPEQLRRKMKLDLAYLDKIRKVDFNKISIYGQVDYLVLKQKIENDLITLQNEEKLQQAISNYIPFADSIYSFEKKRRRGTTVDGRAVAETMNNTLLEINKAKTSLESGAKIEEQKAKYLLSTLDDINARLKSGYNFYNEYDPLFTWWVPKSYEALQKGLEDFKSLVKEKSDIKIFNDGSNIGGNPVGKTELNRLLKSEMIDYNYEDLLRLADQEMAWCKEQVMKATKAMGYGTDWKAALEKVKNSYVAPGKQPELIVNLYDAAINFIKQKKLIDIPELADETWGMIMMTPQRQLVNPFFTGGREISISYPTNTMNYEDKLMSMRGNNPFFSRPTVQHELIPGHHLQFYMNSRYKSYRQAAFNTAFTTEGWALYWEMLLFNEGFFKTPEEIMGAMFWRMHRCARITFSIKFHIGEWTPQQCVDYLVNEVGHEYANAHAEVKRSFEENYGPLYQLAYLIGGLQLMSIHHELVDSGKMTNAEFHDRVIKENHLPMEMVRATLINQKLRPDFKTSWKFYDFKK